MAARLTADPGRSGATSEWRNWQTRQPKELVSERTWGFKSPLRHSGNLRSDLRIGPYSRPRTGRETSRNNANQCEPVINQNGRSAEQVGVPCQGEGRGFEFRRPLHTTHDLSR